MKEKAEPPPVQIGTIDGEPVIAELWYGGDDELEVAEVIYIYTTWMDRQFSTDGKGFINIPHGEYAGFGGDCSLAEFGWLKEAISAGVIDELVLLAQQVVDKPLPQLEKEATA